MTVTSYQHSLCVKQMFDRSSCTYTYLLVDPKTHEGAIIDAVEERLERDLKIISELGVELLYIIETHIHADHVSSAGLLRQLTGAKIVYSQYAAVKAIDIEVNDGDVLPLGQFNIKAIETPGHTNGCMSYYVDGRVFTGDTLLIRGCGRTDFQQGNSKDLYDSITKKLFSLADDTVIYPGHDYNGNTWSTIAEEKKWNPRVGQQKSQADFIQIMSELKLGLPAKIYQAVPANEGCGINFIPDIHLGNDFSMSDLYKVWQQENPENLIIDNRTKEEFIEGHVPHSINIPFGTELQHLAEFKDVKHIYFYCHSGRRAQAALTTLRKNGVENVICVSHSGLPEWVVMGYPVEEIN
jgi:glyoxylase-like metal-dependent hydrolase (beta-lactamase superfamily II)/rhodanese-related sulfurtransferase